MGTFEITAPNGKKYRVTGDTADGAASALAAMLGGDSGPNPDGTYGQPPEGVYLDPTTGQVVDPDLQVARDERIIQSYPVMSRVGEFLQGAPFVGEWADEALGMVDPEAMQRARMISDAFERQRPTEAAALGIAGGVIGSIPAAVSGAGLAMGASTMTGKVLTGAGLGALGGAVEGASTMAGRADTGQRAEAAKYGAAVGAGLGAAIGALAPVVGKGAKSAYQRLKKMDVSVISETLGISKAASKVVKDAIINDDLDKVAATLARKGDDALLAEAGPATSGLLDAAMQTGGQALRVGREAVEGRQAAVAPGLTRTIDDLLGQPGGLRSANRGINQSTAKARKEAFDLAYSQPTPMVGDAARDIEGVLGRVDPRDMQRAAQEANAMMRDEGMTNQNIMASIADDGTVSFSQPLSVAQLDFLARGLYDVAEAGTDSVTGQMSSAARRAANQARDLRNAMKSSVKGYDRALKLGGDTIKARNALMTGRKLLSAGTTKEDVREVMSGADALTKQAIRTGLRENLDEVMGRARSTIASLESGAVDFETGVNEVGQAIEGLRSMLTPNNMTKIRLALGQEDAKKISREIEKVADVLVLKSAVARNSATAIRQSIQQSVKEQSAPGFLRRTFGRMGSPLDAMREVTETVAGIDVRSMSEADKAVFDEIAQVLTSVRGEKAREALDAVRGAIAGQPIKDQQAKLIGEVVTGAAYGSGYQAASQPLAQR